MPAEASLAECCDVMGELQAVFGPREDVEKVNAIAALHAEVARMCEARDTQARDLIREMTRRVAVAERKAEPPESPGAHPARLAELEAARRSAVAAVEQQGTEAEALMAAQRALDGEARLLAQAKQQVDALATEDVPRTKSQLVLYAHISRINWHFEERSRIKGTLSDPAAGDARAIDLAPGELSPVALADHLWGLMGA